MLKKLILLYFSLLFCVLYAQRDNRAIDGIEYDLSQVPPLDLDLIKHEKKEQDASSMQNIKKVMAEVLAEDTQKEKANRLVKNKTKLAKLMKNLTQEENNKSKKKNGKDTVKNAVSRDVRRLLDRQYHDEELVSRKVSMILKHADIRETLACMSKMTGVHLVIDTDVIGTIPNVELKEVPLGAALHIVLTNNNPRLALLKDFGVWRVVRLPVALERLSHVVDDETDLDYQSSCKTLFNARWDEAFKKRVEKLWQGIAGSIDKNGLYIMFDDTSKKVFFRGRKHHIESFEKCLKELDIKIPQIRIDARVIIANKEFDEAIGFQWGGVYDQRASVNHFDFVGLGTFNETTPENPNPIKELLSWSLNLLPASVTNPAIKIPVIFGNKDLNTQRLNLTLNAAENRREIHTILKPSLLVNNDDVAEILVGEQMPQETRLDETIEGKLTNVTTVNYKDIGMKIRIKPIVVPDQQAVYLDIFVENSMVVPISDATRDRFSNGQRTGFNYTIQISQSKNKVILKSGQTTMIGGLISNSKDKVKTGVPILQEIPVVGWFFQGRKKILSDKQLLLFITPTLV